MLRRRALSSSDLQDTVELQANGNHIDTITSQDMVASTGRRASLPTSLDGTCTQQSSATSDSSLPRTDHSMHTTIPTSQDMPLNNIYLARNGSPGLGWPMSRDSSLPGIFISGEIDGIDLILPTDTFGSHIGSASNQEGLSAYSDTDSSSDARYQVRRLLEVTSQLKRQARDSKTHVQAASLLQQCYDLDRHFEECSDSLDDFRGGTQQWIGHGSPNGHISTMPPLRKIQHHFADINHAYLRVEFWTARILFCQTIQRLHKNVTNSITIPAPLPSRLPTFTMETYTNAYNPEVYDTTAFSQAWQLPQDQSAFVESRNTFPKPLADEHFQNLPVITNPITLCPHGQLANAADLSTAPLDFTSVYQLNPPNAYMNPATQVTTASILSSDYGSTTASSVPLVPFMQHDSMYSQDSWHNLAHIPVDVSTSSQVSTPPPLGEKFSQAATSTLALELCDAVSFIMVHTTVATTSKPRRVEPPPRSIPSPSHSIPPPGRLSITRLADHLDPSSNLIDPCESDLSTNSGVPTSHSRRSLGTLLGPLSVAGKVFEQQGQEKKLQWTKDAMYTLTSRATDSM